MSSSLIDLKQYENVTFPDSTILQKNVEEMLVAFRCLKEAYIRCSATEEDTKQLNYLSSIFDRLIEERAKESLKMSVYLEEILDYLQMLTKEDISVEDLLKTLAILKDTVKNRIVDSEKLENQFKEFKADIVKTNAGQPFGALSCDKNDGLISFLQELIIKDGNQSENFQTALKSFLMEVATISFKVTTIFFVIFGLKSFLKLFNINFLIIYGNSINPYRRHSIYKFAKIRENNSSNALERLSSYSNNSSSTSVNSGGTSNHDNDHDNDNGNDNIAFNNSSILQSSYNVAANIFLNNSLIGFACRIVLGYFYCNYDPRILFNRFQKLVNIIKRNRLTIFNRKNNTIVMSKERKQTKEIKEYNEKISTKLPVIITNLTISTQFWKHQSVIIDSHINSLESLSDKRRNFRLPENSINGIIRRWKEEQNHCKESRKMLKDFVDQNSLLNSDSR